MNEPMRQPLRSAVVGAGRISAEHLEFISQTGFRLGLCRPVGVADVSRSLAQFAKDKYEADAYFENHWDLLEKARPQVVHVLTPPHTHAEIIEDSLKAGAHVIAEKPLAVCHADFSRLWELARKMDRRLVEVHNYRFNEPVMEMENLLADGELGELREVEVRMALAIEDDSSPFADRNLPHSCHRLPCGALHEFLPHLCYLALHFCQDFDRVAAAWSKLGDNPLFKFNDLDAVLIGGPVRARIRFTSQAQPDCLTLTVRGSRGWTEVDLFHPFVKLVAPRRREREFSPLINHWTGGWQQIAASIGGFKDNVMQKTPYEGLHTFLGRTYAALVKGEAMPVSFEEMDRVSRLIDALGEQLSASRSMQRATA
jgi:predicted dehydrogenase